MVKDDDTTGPLDNTNKGRRMVVVNEGRADGDDVVVNADSTATRC